MLNTSIAETFAGANNAQKATMIRTIPVELLSTGTDVFSHLGEDNEIWLAYLMRVGSVGVRALSQQAQREHILPLLQYDQGHTTIVTLMQANVFVTEAVEVLQRRLSLHDENFKVSQYTKGLRAIQERALPIILVMLETEDPYELQYAFHSFNVEEWTEADPRSTLSEAVYQTLQRSEHDFILEHCGRVLAVTNPEALVTFATESMKTWNDKDRFGHPLRKADKAVVEAYHATEDTSLRQQFVLQSLAIGMPWFGLSSWEAVATITRMGVDTFKSAFTGTTNYTRTNLGGAIRFVRDRPQKDVEMVVSVVTTAIRQLINEGYPPNEMAGFLAQAQNTFTEDDYVEFMVMIQERGGDIAELSQYHYYDDSTPAQMVQYMQRLDGIAKTDAALMVLHKLKDVRNAYRRYNDAFVAAMDVIVGAFTGIGLPIRTLSDEAVQNVPFKHWSMYLDRILTDGRPHWAIRFAAYALKNVDENHELAKATMARMMLVDDENIQWFIARFLSDD